MKSHVTEERATRFSSPATRFEITGEKTAAVLSLFGATFRLLELVVTANEENAQHESTAVLAARVERTTPPMQLRETPPAHLMAGGEFSTHELVVAAFIVTRCSRSGIIALRSVLRFE